MKKSEKEFCEKVIALEQMRVESATHHLLDWNSEHLDTMIHNVLEIESWLQECKILIEHEADQPRRWAQAMLAHKKFMILAFDTVESSVIIRMFAIDAQGTVLFDSYVKPEDSILQQVTAAEGVMISVLEHAPSLSQAWSSLRPIVNDAYHLNPFEPVPRPIVSYDLCGNFGFEIVWRNHLRYDSLRQDPIWFSLSHLTQFIDECMYYFREENLSSSEALATFCQRIQYELPPLPKQTARDRAIAQLRLLQAMAKGSYRKEVFSKEE